jgi:hypothetical protein
MDEKLRCYFVEAKGHEEPNGVAVIANNPGKAKMYAFGYLCQFDVEWVDLRPRITKDANIIGLTDGCVFGDVGDKLLWDALYRHIYAGLYCGVCPNCKTEDVDVREIYDDVFGCDHCEKNLTKESINNPYVKGEIKNG